MMQLFYPAIVHIYYILAEKPSFARENKNLKKNFGKKLDFFSLKHPLATHECPQNISAHSVQPFGRLWETYIYDVFFYYIEDWIHH